MIKHYSNNQIKKRAAENHNKERAKAKQDEIELAQDKIDNPEKYKPRRRTRKDIQAQAFIAHAMAISPNGFNSRLSK